MPNKYTVTYTFEADNDQEASNIYAGAYYLEGETGDPSWELLAPGEKPKAKYHVRVSGTAPVWADIEVEAETAGAALRLVSEGGAPIHIADEAKWEFSEGGNGVNDWTTTGDVYRILPNGDAYEVLEDGQPVAGIETLEMIGEDNE